MVSKGMNTKKNKNKGVTLFALTNKQHKHRLWLRVSLLFAVFSLYTIAFEVGTVVFGNGVAAGSVVFVSMAIKKTIKIFKVMYMECLVWGR